MQGGGGRGRRHLHRAQCLGVCGDVCGRGRLPSARPLRSGAPQSLAPPLAASGLLCTAGWQQRFCKGPLAWVSLPEAWWRHGPEGSLPRTFHGCMPCFIMSDQQQLLWRTQLPVPYPAAASCALLLSWPAVLCCPCRPVRRPRPSSSSTRLTLWDASGTSGFTAGRASAMMGQSAPGPVTAWPTLPQAWFATARCTSAPCVCPDAAVVAVF